MAIRAYRLSANQVFRHSEADEFWPMLHISDRVDELPDLSIGQFGMISECLMEWSIRLPRGQGIGLPIQPDAHTCVLLCLSRHDARVLRTRLDKQPALSEND